MEYTMLIVKVKFSLLVLFPVLFILPLIEVRARDNLMNEKDMSSFFYDEIPVFVMVEGYKGFYVDAIYANNNLLYVNVAALFQNLNIPCAVWQQGDSLSGFIENESHDYLIDYKQRQIKTGTKIIKTNNGLVKETGALYLESNLFAEAFGLTLTFNYRALTIVLKSDFELPIIKRQRLEKIRNNIAKIKGEEIADTLVQRDYHLFRFGMVDWSAASYQTWKGPTDNHFSLGVGSELLYGEADVSLNYYSQYKFDKRQQYFIWRWVDNDRSIVKQVQLGRISGQTISFINSPVVGAVVRNSPTTVRKATGYYTISEFTEPNWTVELYINNVMVDYTKADALGLYVFKVPNVYGYTTLKLKFYGPLGEEHTEERTMNVPYTVMPSQEFEYGLSAGVLEDSSHSRFGRGEFNYGVNRILTVGGGLEYLSSIPNGASIPFANATIQPFSKLTFTGEYAYGVKTRGLLDYYFWKDALLEIDYAKYVEGQLATRFNALEEQKVKLSLPFRIYQIIGSSKFDYSRFIYKEFNYNQADALVSTCFKQFSAGSSAQFNWIDDKPAYATVDLSLSYRYGKGYVIRSSAQYNISGSKFISYKAAIEKSIPKGYFIVSYERDFLYNDNFINFNFRYDLSFARTNVSVSHSNEKIYTSESAQGSLAFGSGKRHVHKSNNPSISKGGIALYPFLDLNQNGVFDAGEPMVKLTSVRVTGSKAIFSEKDSIIRIADLYAFTNCIVEFNDNDLENIAWRFKYKKYQVLIDPNQFKRIDIPIIPVGEVSGMSYINTNNALIGIGRILVKFYNRNNTKIVAQTLSESDGFISYLGLEPGEYIACVDSVQLNNLDFTVKPRQINFRIKAKEEGDIVSDLDFILYKKENAEAIKIDSSTVISIVKDSDKIEYVSEDTINTARQNNTVYDSTAIIIDNVSGSINNPGELIWGEKCNPTGYYYVQCGAFRSLFYARKMAMYIRQNSEMVVGIVRHNGLYKVRVECVSNKEEALKIKNRLQQKNVSNDMFVVIRK